MQRLSAKLRLFDWLMILTLLFLSFLLTFDLFASNGRPITYDGAIHMTNIANFSQALSQGQWPVVWANDFANFGLPTPLFVQQTSSYLGAWINFFTHDVVLSFNILCLLSLFLSATFFYFWLLIYFPRPIAALSAVLLMVAPYRLLNLYSRGALPELFASIFVPLVAIGFYFLLKKRRYWLGFLMTSLSLAALLLSHPMMSVVYAFILGSYALFLLIQVRLAQKSWSEFYQQEKFAFFNFIFAGVAGLFLAGYYLLPLVLEAKYLVQGQLTQVLRNDTGLNFGQIWSSSWPYWQIGADIGPRLHVLHLGILEGCILVLAVIVVLVWFFGRQKKWRAQKSLFLALVYVLLVALILLFFLSESSTWLFLRIPFLSQVQHHWRFLAALLFLPPIVLALLLQMMAEQKWFFYLVMILIFANLALVFSQAYGKNYFVYDQKHYYFTRHNLHGNDLETVWSGGTGVLPAKIVQTEIVEGAGALTMVGQTDIKRELIVEASESVRVVDYTYYFPGWVLTVNGQEQTLEFQDPNYRGLMTYRLPAGVNRVVLEYHDTKVRFFGKLSTIIGLMTLTSWLVYLRYRRKTS